ncbi:MAG: Uma2 family endonuclease [Pyrinomonadaceae bacterium]
MSAKIEPVLTVTDLDAMPDDGNRYELFNGEITVSRAPTLSHQRILGNLYALLRIYLDKNPVGEVLLTPGVIFDDFNSAIPDAVFLNHRQLSSIGSGERITEAPDLVIEIVSPGRENARCDREVKRQVYGKHGVKEYWIADPDMRSLEIYRLESSALKLVVTLTDEDEITTPMLPGFRCKSHQIF